MSLAKEQQNPELLEAAISTLSAITVEHPEHWAALFNLGQAYLQQGEEPRAIATWEKCKALAKTAEETWQTEAALADAEGRPIPPAPAPAPADSGAMGAGGASHDPHAGMGGAAGSSGDPHGAPADPHGGM